MILLILQKKSWITKHDYITFNCDTRIWTTNFTTINMNSQKKIFPAVIDYKNSAEYYNDKNEVYQVQKKISDDKRNERMKTSTFNIETKKLLEPQIEIKKEMIKEKQEVAKKETEKITEKLDKIAEKTQEVSENIIQKIDYVKYLDDTSDRDDLFGLIKISENVYTFGALAELDIPSKLAIIVNESKVSIITEDNKEDFLNSDELMILLTKDFPDIDEAIKSRIALNNYKKIIKFSMGKELIKFTSKRGKKTSKEEEINKSFLENNKYTKWILNWINESKSGRGLLSYKELAKKPLILPSNPHQQLKRALILMGSVRAGNNNIEILKELSGLLDELLREKIIDKTLYKVLFHKTKDLLYLNANRRNAGETDKSTEQKTEGNI